MSVLGVVFSFLEFREDGSQVFFGSGLCFLSFVCCQYFAESSEWYSGYCVCVFGLGRVLCVVYARLVVFVFHLFAYLSQDVGYGNFFRWCRRGTAGL